MQTKQLGVTIVHHPSNVHVIAQIGWRNVPSVTSADKGKTHTILACVSASGLVIPPFMVYPAKSRVVVARDHRRHIPVILMRMHRYPVAKVRVITRNCAKLRRYYALITRVFTRNNALFFV